MKNMSCTPCICQKHVTQIGSRNSSTKNVSVTKWPYFMNTSILIIAGTKTTNLPVNLKHDMGIFQLAMRVYYFKQNHNFKLRSHPRKSSNSYSITPLLFDEKKQAQPNLEQKSHVPRRIFSGRNSLKLLEAHHTHFNVFFADGTCC